MPLKLMVRGATRQTSMVDLLDRILDKGIVIVMSGLGFS